MLFIPRHRVLSTVLGIGVIVYFALSGGGGVPPPWMGLVTTDNQRDSDKNEIFI